MELENKVAIVTGGGRGIGRAIAVSLARNGADVVIASRTQGELNSTADETKKIGRKVLEIKTDVRKLNDLKNLVKKTLDEFGRIDILVNNAGIALVKSLVETSEKEWRDIIDTNLSAVFLLSKEVLPTMIKQKNGVIVNISSGAGKRGCDEFSAYCASKFGVIGITESLAPEVEENGIRVYAVCPGPVDTKMWRDIDPNYVPSTKPEDVAEKVLSLVLPNSKTRTGSSVDVH